MLKWLKFLTNFDDYFNSVVHLPLCEVCSLCTVVFWKNGELKKWSGSAFDRFLITFLRKTFFQSIPSQEDLQSSPSIVCLHSTYANPGVELYDYISWWYRRFLKVLFQKGHWQSFSKTSTPVWNLVASINIQKSSNDRTKTNFDIWRRKLIHLHTASLSTYYLDHTNIYTV